MSLSVALLLFSVASAPQSAENGAETDLTIVARRLDGVIVSVSRDARGKTGCSLSQSTGLARLDEALCRTAAACVKRGAATMDAIKACIDARKPALLDDVRRQMKRGAA